ncbi:MAG: right-handed parallel beta-helix repeat-containing protein [Armatimonadota bacterium]|jgi:parallel beta-helix repeat protein
MTTRAKPSAGALMAGLCLLLVTVGRGSAATYYVAQGNAKASDRGPGTAVQPWKTINHAAQVLKPGDTVIVKAGIYREAVQPARSGEPGKPIIYQAAPGETVVVSGAYPVADWQRDGKIWRRSKWQADLPKEDGLTPRPQMMVQKDGVYGEAVALYPVLKREDLREGYFYVDQAAQEISAIPIGEADFQARPPEVAIRSVVFSADRKNYVQIEGFQFRHSSWITVAVGGDHNLIEGNTITWSGFGGLSVSGEATTVRNNDLSYNGDNGLGGAGINLLIEENRMNHNNQRLFDSWWHAGGAKLIGEWTDAAGVKHGGFSKSIIRNNEAAYNVGPGIWLDTECDDNIIEGNRGHDNEGPGIMVEVSQRNLVRNNLAYRNRNPVTGYYLTYIPNHDFEDYPPVLRSSTDFDGFGIYVSSSPYTKVLHNTCYSNEGPGIVVGGGDRTENPNLPWTPSHAIVMDNLLMNNQGEQLMLQRNLKNGADEYANISDYNLLFGASERRLAASNGYGAGDKYQSLADWQNASGQDAHSVWGEPLFQRAIEGDFRLLPGSAALGKGRLHPDAPLDITGRERPENKVDIGAYQSAL